MKAPHWHNDLILEYRGPDAGYVTAPGYGTGNSEVATAAPRCVEGGVEPFRDAFRVVCRAMYEAHLLRRQRLFAIVNRLTGEDMDPLGEVNFRNYYPILRPALPELLASYALHLRLNADQVLAYPEAK